MEYLDKWRRAARRNLITSLASRKAICETLRLIYDEIHDMPNSSKKEIITELLVDAMLRAKKMQDRLVYYRRTYKDTTGSGGEHIEKLLGNVQRRRMRKARSWEPQ